MTNAVLVARVAELEAENMVLRARVEEQALIIAAQAEQITLLLAQVEMLAAKITILEGLLRGDSSNSSRPPSSDGNTAKNKRPISNSRKRREGEPKRAQGKQRGAPGVTLNPVDEPDQVVVHAPTECRGCGAGLDDAVVVAESVRQVFDIPQPVVVVVEHRSQRRKCACGCETTAVFPREATAPTCYGPNVKAYAIYLLVRQHVPQERCAEALADMFGATVSVGTLNNWLTEAAETLATFLVAVTAGLRAAPVIGVDETSVRSKKTKLWVHIARTRLLTLLYVHEKGRQLAAIQAGPLTGYTGVVIHDRYSSYFAFGDCAHALCNAHVARNLEGVGLPKRQQAWTTPMLNLIFDTKTRVDEIRARGGTGLTPTELAKVRRRWGEIVNQGLTINPEQTGTHKYQPHVDARNLALALRDRRDMFLAYTTNPNIDWDNNGAERDFRHIKLQAKISGEFRSLHGAQRFATTRSYISTTIKHGLSPLKNLALLFTEHGAWLPPSTTLT